MHLQLTGPCTLRLASARAGCLICATSSREDGRDFIMDLGDSEARCRWTRHPTARVDDAREALKRAAQKAVSSSRAICLCARSSPDERSLHADLRRAQRMPQALFTEPGCSRSIQSVAWWTAPLFVQAVQVTRAAPLESPAASMGDGVLLSVADIVKWPRLGLMISSCCLRPSSTAGRQG